MHYTPRLVLFLPKMAVFSALYPQIDATFMHKNYSPFTHHLTHQCNFYNFFGVFGTLSSGPKPGSSGHKNSRPERTTPPCLKYYLIAVYRYFKGHFCIYPVKYIHLPKINMNGLTFTYQKYRMRPNLLKLNSSKVTFRFAAPVFIFSCNALFISEVTGFLLTY